MSPQVRDSIERVSLARSNKKKPQHKRLISNIVEVWQTTSETTCHLDAMSEKPFRVTVGDYNNEYRGIKIKYEKKNKCKYCLSTCESTFILAIAGHAENPLEPQRGKGDRAYQTAYRHRTTHPNSLKPTIYNIN